MDIPSLFKELTESVPVKLADLPKNEFGIYALWDHEGQIRYIGCTPKKTEGFRTRIHNKHSTGSEGSSHKFSQAYCTGRMWRYSERLGHPAKAEEEQSLDDPKVAKKLRTAFIRRYCAATYISIPPNSLPEPYFSSLTSLETELKKMAPASMRAWEGLRFSSLPEPKELVDSLLDERPDLAVGAERQGAIYKKHVLKATT